MGEFDRLPDPARCIVLTSIFSAHSPYLIPLFYVAHLWTTFLVNRKIPTSPATPAEAALVPQNPKDRPSFADVTTQGVPAGDNAVHQEHPHVVPDSPSSGSISKRNKKKKNGATRQAQLTAAGDGTDGSDSDSALVKFQKLPRHRPAPRATLSQLVRSLVFGTPTPTSSFLNYASIAVNTLLFALAMDAIWTPVFGMDEHSLAFARVGAVSHNEVKIVARIPAESSLVPHQSDALAYNSTFPVSEGLLPEDDFTGAKIVYRPTKPLGKWIAGPDILTSEANDWVSTVKLEGLWASTEYECMSSHSHSSKRPLTVSGCEQTACCDLRPFRSPITRRSPTLKPSRRSLILRCRSRRTTRLHLRRVSSPVSLGPVLRTSGRSKEPIRSSRSQKRSASGSWSSSGELTSP